MGITRVGSSIEDGLSNNDGSGCVSGPGVSNSMGGSGEVDVVVSGSVVGGSGEDAGVFGLALSVGDVVFGREEKRFMVELVNNGRDKVIEV